MILGIIDVNETAPVMKGGEDKWERLSNGKEYVAGLIKRFPEKRFLLLLSTIEQSAYFDVNKLNTFVVCPSIKLFDTLKGNIDAAEDREKILNMEKERLSLIRETDTGNLNIFDSFDELYQVIKTVYKLQSTF